MGGGEGERGYTCVGGNGGGEKVGMWKVRHGGMASFCWALYGDRPGKWAGDRQDRMAHFLSGTLLPNITIVNNQKLQPVQGKEAKN